MQVKQVFQQEANSGASSGARILNTHRPYGQHHFCSWYWLGSHKFSSYKPGRLYVGPNTKKLWLYTHTHTINLGFKNYVLFLLIELTKKTFYSWYWLGSHKFSSYIVFNEINKSKQNDYANACFTKPISYRLKPHIWKKGPIIFSFKVYSQIKKNWTS